MREKIKELERKLEEKEKIENGKGQEGDRETE